jgi:hypothetical protein
MGDSLTGPFWEQMLSWPSKPKEKFKEGVYKHIETHLRAALFDALRHVRRFEATVGVSGAEVNDKVQAKAELDEALLPFRIAAAAWSGGVMLGPEKCDDAAYIELLEYIGATHELPDAIESDGLRAMIAKGVGLSNIPADKRGLENVVTSSRYIPALSFDLTFPEVFYPNGIPFARSGFGAVLGNPPWDRVRPAKKEFLAAFDFEILNAATAREGTIVETRLLSDPEIAPQYQRYVDDFDQQGQIHDAIYAWHEIRIGDVIADRGNSDLYIVFMERGSQLLMRSGTVGVLVPSGPCE